MGFIEEIEDEVGPIGDAERGLIERELDLAATFAAGIAGRLPENGTPQEKHQAITELLHEDPQLVATFLELVEVSRSNRASPMASIARLEEQIG